MTKLSKDQVLHIAKLARLSLTDEEAEKFSGELSSILGYVEMLQEVKTDGVVATSSVTGLQTVLRDDVITPQQASPDALISTSPLPIVDHQIQTPSAHG